ncbi:hypothetical protein [Cellulomonas flavigena]|uniref:hypothetical protein n=1 Tax=Cellulomonas flavigena TaxID=1711 RepID=UPI0011D20841|nr:hypothetical protein [Cellulomonas flavigena]
MLLPEGSVAERVEFGLGYTAGSIEIDLAHSALRLQLDPIGGDAESIGFELSAVTDFYTINQPPQGRACFGYEQAVIHNIDVATGRVAESHVLLFQFTGLDFCVETGAVRFVEGSQAR